MATTVGFFLPVLSIPTHPYNDSVLSEGFGLRFSGFSDVIPSEGAELTRYPINLSGIVGAEIVRIRNLRRIFFNLN